MHRQTHKNKTVKMGIEDHANQFDSFKFDERERKNNSVNHQKTAYGSENEVLVGFWRSHGSWRFRGDSNT